MQQLVHNLIEKITQDIKEQNVSAVFENDRTLSAIRDSLLTQIHTQASIHKAQMDFIFKQKIWQLVTEGFYAVAVLLGINLALSSSSEGYQIFFALATLYPAWALIDVIKAHAGPRETSSALIDRMNGEKEIHVDTLVLIDIITEFQQNTNEAIQQLHDPNEKSDIGQRMEDMIQEYYGEMKKRLQSEENKDEEEKKDGE